MTQAQQGPPAKVNVSLKGVTNGEPWITVEGDEGAVRRQLWLMSNSAKPFAEAGDLVGATYAADAEFKARRDAAPKAQAQTQVPSGAEQPVATTGAYDPNQVQPGVTEQAVENIQDAFGDVKVEDRQWHSGPADPEPANEPHTCKHGPRAYSERLPGDPSGKAPYKAWFCNAPQGTPKAEKCDPEWAD